MLRKSTSTRNLFIRKNNNIIPDINIKRDARNNISYSILVSLILSITLDAIVVAIARNSVSYS